MEKLTISNLIGVTEEQYDKLLEMAEDCMTDKLISNAVPAVVNKAVGMSLSPRELIEVGVLIGSALEYTRNNSSIR